MKKIAFVASVLLSAGSVLATAACTGGAPGTGSEGVQQDTGSQQEIRYMIGQPEDPADLELIKADLKTFESKNQGITVKLDVIPSENVRTVLQTQLRSGEGPDVFGYDTGPGFAGALAKAGLVHDLTSAYADHKWPVYDFAKQRVTFDGKIVGVPSQIEEVGVFYNKTLFAKYGISQPKNLTDLTAAAEKLKQNNVVPFAVSDKEGWQGGHLLSMSLSSAVGSKGMDDLLNGRMSWDSQPVVDSLAVWKDWNDKKLLTPSPTAVSYDNANALFYSGKAAMNPTGSWLALDIERNAKFDVGFIPFPAKDGVGIFSGGLGSGTFVSASTKKVDASIKFLDYLLTAEHGRWAAEKLQDIPAYPIDTAGMKASPLFKQVLDDSAKIADGTGDFGYNIDVLTTDVFNNAMWKGIQAILSGQSNAAEVADQLQAAYQKSAK
ncbi:MAG TPA: extracellular solute-binding protein [Kribbella sp.]|nr:extracellular solute-binding protein [Kribbella sp.]